MSRRVLPDQTTKEGRAGLTQCLEEKRNEAIGKTKLLPLVVYPHWVKDKVR